MMRYSKTSVVFILCVMANMTGFDRAHSEESDISNAAVLFLLVTNSPRANAMGGCIVNLVDEQAALHNPGALGLFHLNKTIGVSFPNNTKWLPELADDLRLKTWGISVGVSERQVRPSHKRRLNWSIALAYSRTKMDYGRFAITEPNSPEVLGYFDSWDKADYYSIGIGIEYFLRLGVGYTHKKIESHLADFGSGSESGAGSASGTAHDFGIIAELPFSELVPHKIYLRESDKYFFHYDLTPSFAYVQANIGDDIAYIDASQADPLPQISRTGVSLYTAINLSNSVLSSWRFVLETERYLYSRPDKMTNTGYEIGFFGTIYYRAGTYREVDTYGLGFRLQGVISWLDTFGKLGSENRFLSQLVRNLDLSYDFAKYDGSALSDKKFFKLSLSL